ERAAPTTRTPETTHIRLFSVCMRTQTSRKETVMPAGTPQPYAAFRLNFEQQQKRAKELLKAANAGDATALLRLTNTGFTAAPFKLAHTQHCIAKELRFKNWAALKQHVTRME